MDENQRSVEYLDQLSIQVARVVYSAAYYEDELTVMIATALDLTALQCNALVRPMPNRGKLDLCERLVASGSDDAQKWVKKHARRVRKLFDQRNALVHGTFGHDDQDRVTVRSYQGRTKLLGNEERWDAARISDLADCIRNMQDQLSVLAAHLATSIQGAQTTDY